MNKIIIITFLIAGVINFVPIMGMLGVEQLNRLYGVSLTNPDLILAMQHRAVLLGCVGGLILVAAFVPGFRSVAIALGLISMISFLVFYVQVGGANDLMRRVAVADIVAIISLSVGAGVHFWQMR